MTERSSCFWISVQSVFVGQPSVYRIPIYSKGQQHCRRRRWIEKEIEEQTSTVNAASNSKRDGDRARRREREKQFNFSSSVYVCAPEWVWVCLCVSVCGRTRVTCVRSAAYVSPSVRSSDTPQIFHITYMERSARLAKRSRFYYACDAVRVLLIAHVSIYAYCSSSCEWSTSAQN